LDEDSDQSAAFVLGEGIYSPAIELMPHQTDSNSQPIQDAERETIGLIELIFLVL
jgi:hypothetical protein